MYKEHLHKGAASIMHSGILTCCQQVVQCNRWQAYKVGEAVEKGAHSEHVTALLVGQVCSKGRHQVEAGGRELRPFWQVAAALVWLILCARAIPAPSAAADAPGQDMQHLLQHLAGYEQRYCSKLHSCRALTAAHCFDLEHLLRTVADRYLY